jgi:deoxyadenosine/deoxycytidine kinase
VVDGTLRNDPTVVSLENNLAKVKYHLKEVKTLGIVGMGGIGKTTLAKAIFDDVKSTYNASCFVGQLKSRSLLDILREILSKFGVDGVVKDLVHAHKSMEELLVKNKALLILDDVKDEAQVDDIVPMVVLDRTKCNTLVITTRDWGAIRNRVSENGRKFDVSRLDDDAAKTLFNIHSSWEASHLSSEFNDIRDMIVEACKGLPLSLKVVGTYLHGKGKLRSWERALQRMKKGRNLDGEYDEIWNSLRVSFDDGLDQEDKNMFLDIACFFGGDVYPSGMSKETTLCIWTNNNIPPISALENLVHQALVTIEIDHNGDEILQMHDQLRAMGQMIAEKEYAGTRIWNTNGLTSCLVFH